MTPMEKIRQHWNCKFDEVEKTPTWRRMYEHTIQPKHYAGWLRQIFHHARENPQLQTLATVHFRGEQRAMVKPFFKHATSEIGHDQLALDDLKTLGFDTTRVPWERPLPATTALLGYAFYQIQHLDPIGYLGYLLTLEFMPTRAGNKVMECLEAIGVPRAAMTFIHDHATVDIGHNKLMEMYVEHLVKTPAQIDTVLYSAETTADLYTRMIGDAFDWADRPQPTPLSPFEQRPPQLELV